MKLKITLLAFLLCGIGFLQAQINEVDKVESSLTVDIVDTIPNGWRFGGVTSLNFSQLYLSNWAAGGLSSISLNGLGSAFASYKKGSFIWDNTLDVGYGFVRQPEDKIKFKKTDDRFELNSKVGYKAFSNFYYSGLVNFKTQFDKGYDYKAEPAADGSLPNISDFLAPAYLTAALGLSYQPNDYFNVLLAPVTGRMTIVTVDSLRPVFSVDLDKSTRTEFGGYVRAVFSKNDFKPAWLRNITLTSKLDLFTNYLEEPNIDVNWEVLIAMKINRFLSVNISTHLIYDEDIILPDEGKVQFKELLGVGLSYNF